MAHLDDKPRLGAVLPRLAHRAQFGFRESLVVMLRSLL